jgi:hypothetical protein
LHFAGSIERSGEVVSLLRGAAGSMPQHHLGTPDMSRIMNGKLRRLQLAKEVGIERPPEFSEGNLVDALADLLPIEPAAVASYPEKPVIIGGSVARRVAQP